MNIEQAIEVLEASFARGSSTPVIDAEDREAFIQAENVKLLSHVIEPTPVVVTSASFSEYDFSEFAQGPVYAIARSEEQCFLYNPVLDKYALAWGKDYGDLCMLGFALDDALCEWRG